MLGLELAEGDRLGLAEMLTLALADIDIEDDGLGDTDVLGDMLGLTEELTLELILAEGDKLLDGLGLIETETDAEGDNDGLTLTLVDGLILELGDSEGLIEGLIEGLFEGLTLALPPGGVEGDALALGDRDGLTLGDKDGETLGLALALALALVYVADVPMV